MCLETACHPRVIMCILENMRTLATIHSTTSTVVWLIAFKAWRASRHGFPNPSAAEGMKSPAPAQTNQHFASAHIRLTYAGH